MTRGPLRPFGFASLRQPDACGAGASRLCGKQNAYLTGSLQKSRRPQSAQKSRTLLRLSLRESSSRGALRLLRSSRYALTQPDAFGAGASRDGHSQLSHRIKGIGSGREKRMDNDFLVNCSTPFLVASRSDATPCKDSWSREAQNMTT